MTTPSETAVNAAVRGLLHPFSVEITPREATELPPLSDVLDPGTAVYLTFLPRNRWEQTVAAARWVGPSLKVLRQQPGGLFKLAPTSTYPPDEPLLDVGAAVAADPGSLMHAV